ncbi:DNA-binding WRKY [Macleaya cordata]|uniref:DNA-binding WRKY n=1 Tax=Macleaya cordata TaxID=56857 RepID=A0A200QLT2_MACCD|nr:DNA-binding WRKY [Macleaya cordata]
MEINTGELEPNALLNELIQGKELVKELRTHLKQPSSTGESLIGMLLSSYDRAISMANKTGCDPRITAGLISPGSLESPRSKSESPRSDDSGPSDLSKRRKTQPKWTDKVRVGAATTTGIEGLPDDGYSWRKYGQKDILGATYPRGYYRCTYRKTQGCSAKRQVQRSSSDPSILDITYQGKHTCHQVSHLLPVSQLQKNQNQNPNQNQNQNQGQQEEQKPKVLSQQVLVNFEAGLRIKTENDLLLDNQDLPYSSSFSFTSTSMPIGCIKNENNNFSSMDQDYYFRSCHDHMNSIGGALQNFHTTSESNFTHEIISTATSASDSTIMDMDFTLDTVDLDPNFPFPNFFN